MNRLIPPFLLLVLMIPACKSSATLDQQIVATWKMEKVIEYGADVTSKHHPANNRWITFNPDGTFLSDGDPFGPNKGRWSVKPRSNILTLDSDVDDDDSDWNVVVDGDLTTWTGRGHERKENTTLVHRRVRE